MVNHWFRAHHGISNDTKLAVLALKTGTKRCEVGWVWMTLLDHASQNEADRGSINGLSAEEIAFMAEIDLDRVNLILNAMRERGMLSPSGKLTSWEKRNPKREDESATERKRRQRDRQKQPEVTPLSDDVPQGHADVTQCPDREEERRVEERRDTTSSSNSELKHCPADAGLSSPPPSKEKHKRPQKVWYDQSFEEWYQGWWNRKGKAPGRKAHEKAINRLVDKQKIGYNQAKLFLLQQRDLFRDRFEHTRSWDASVGMHPSTWLNQERWTDEISPADLLRKDSGKSRDMVSNVTEMFAEELQGKGVLVK